MTREKVSVERTINRYTIIGNNETSNIFFLNKDLCDSAFPLQKKEGSSIQEANILQQFQREQPSTTIASRSVIPDMGIADAPGCLEICEQSYLCVQLNAEIGVITLLSPTPRV